MTPLDLFGIFIQLGGLLFCSYILRGNIQFLVIEEVICYGVQFPYGMISAQVEAIYKRIQILE